MTSGSSAHDVALEWSDGREERVSVVEGEPILAAAEHAGVALPFGCRTGACATCTGKLLDGRIEHARPPRALKERHHESGYVLLCIAEPRSDCRIAVGSSVQAELVSNPWR
ncbi:2Fe-2S iron-sulfur cluster-binding protein [Halococcus saccharolyticus]|uniref:Ferredoxin n=1 Tax=Halococcus saccharolyticus DSM 5350 TaxID=1227455 RepID=M0MHE4_9EURY|nr:2Fe-2S iron-sulfur cluster-binding protein [Halococcus saccharolyticus]EMA44768.1 ferredoxin [Halococcus saccharolyticus DSM 5350]